MSNLYTNLIKIAYMNPKHRDKILPLLRKFSRTVNIPWDDILEAEKSLKRLMKKYKKYEGMASSSPAGPDTSKFRATHSGFLDVGRYGDPSYLLIGIKIGTNFYPNPYNISDEYPDWKRENARRERLVEQIKRDADKVLIPFLRAHGLDKVFRKPESKSGSNYSTYGIPYKNWMKVG